MRVLKVDTLLVSEYAIRVRPSWGRGGAIAQGTAVWIRQNAPPPTPDALVFRCVMKRHEASGANQAQAVPVPKCGA